MRNNAARIVVGVVPGQPGAVVTTAARFAEQFDADLILACVEGDRYMVVHDREGNPITDPVDAGLIDTGPHPFNSGLEASIADHLTGFSGEWSVRALVGEAGEELSVLADDTDAIMIVVGTREAGLRGSLHEFFGGSVAVHLAHHQHRPVVVVPLDPIPAGRKAPWLPE